MAVDPNASPRTVKEIDSHVLIKLRLKKVGDIIYGIPKGKIAALEMVRSGNYGENRTNAVDDMLEPPEGSEFPDRATRITKVIVRDAKVRAFAIKRANGSCEHCGVPGFKTTNGGN